MTANPCPFKIAMSKKALLSHLPGYYKGRMGTGLLIFESTEYMLIIFAYRNSEFTVFDPADLRYGCVLWFGAPSNNLVFLISNNKNNSHSPEVLVVASKNIREC